MKKPTETQRSVLRHMADGWRLVERVYDYCALFPSGPGAVVSVRFATLHALFNAGYIDAKDRVGLSRTYTLTDAGRDILALAPTAGREP